MVIRKNHNIISTPIGDLVAEVQNNALTSLSFIGSCAGHEFDDASSSGDAILFEMVELQLNQYFKKQRKHFELPLSQKGTEFQLKVWNELVHIKYGQTISYGELSYRVTGSSKSSRAVANACKKNPLAIIVPCHRVIASNGDLGGYGGNLASNIEKKKFLLKLECIKISTKN